MKMNRWWINLLIAVIFGVATIGVWAMSNKPSAEPPWPYQVAGMSFSPLRAGNDPEKNLYPRHEEIDSDLGLLAGKVRAIRTYGLGGCAGRYPCPGKKVQNSGDAWGMADLQPGRK